MLSGIGERVLACDLDPQANLTSSFLNETQLESLWDSDGSNRTIYQCVKPLTEVGDLRKPCVHRATDTLDSFPATWRCPASRTACPANGPMLSAKPIFTARFASLRRSGQIMQMGAEDMEATIILVDVGRTWAPSNRSALIATDHVIAPLGADLFSLQGLRIWGPTLTRWKAEWSKRLKNWNPSDFPLPAGAMEPIGYIVQQHGVRLGRPVKAYDKWVNRMPEAYARYLLNQGTRPFRRQAAK